MSHQEVFPSVRLPVKSAVWTCMAPLPLTSSHLKNWLYLFSDLIREGFHEACPRQPLRESVSPAGGEVACLKGAVSPLPSLPLCAPLTLILRVNTMLR